MGKKSFEEILKKDKKEITESLREARKDVLIAKIRCRDPESGNKAKVHLLRKGRKTVAVCMTALSHLSKNKKT